MDVFSYGLLLLQQINMVGAMTKVEEVVAVVKGVGDKRKRRRMR